MITQERIEEIVKQYADEYYLMTDETIANAAAAIMAEMQAASEGTTGNEKPKQLEIKDFAPVIKLCQEYIDTLDSRGYEIKDIKHYILEAAVACVFGESVWNWVNSKIDEGYNKQ